MEAFVVAEDAPGEVVGRVVEFCPVGRLDAEVVPDVGQRVAAEGVIDGLAVDGVEKVAPVGWPYWTSRRRWVSFKEGWYSLG